MCTRIDRRNKPSVLSCSQPGRSSSATTTPTRAQCQGRSLTHACQQGQTADDLAHDVSCTLAPFALLL